MSISYAPSQQILVSSPRVWPWRRTRAVPDAMNEANRLSREERRVRTDALVARANIIRAQVTAAADELSGLTRELRELLTLDQGDTDVQRRRH